jgi:hypothetical protein
MSGVRWALVVMAAVAGILLWEAWDLELWSFSGPGPGLFPQAVAIAVIALAALCFLLPERGGGPADDDGVTDFMGAGRDERRTFKLYLLGLVILVPGIIWAGFFLTTIAVVTFLMRVAERRPWTQGIAFGAIIAVVGIVGFGGLLQVALPESAVDAFLLSQLREGLR